MIYGSMRHYSNGRKKKYNAWTTTKKQPKFVPMELVAVPTPIRGDTSHIPSNHEGGHACSKREALKYTGTLVKGISTMHKSNAVPIINEQEAKDHASMRR